MPFEFSLGDPTEIYTGIEGDYTVDFDLGVDSDTNERVFMQVALYEHEDAPNPFSLLYGIRRENLDTGEISGASFDHDTVRELVPRDQRSGVLENVLDSIHLLVEGVEPFEIIMETYEPSLNEQAMRKFHIVSRHLEDLGYTVSSYQRDGTDQRDHWLFTK